jgi:hypothetical protein
MDGQDIGQRLGGKTSPDTPSRQFGINGPQPSPQLGGIQRVERGQHASRRVEAEHLHSDLINQIRLQVDVK